MNIIQIQDRLKGLPTDALVNYVEQPMGEVPIYLALGELQRRKEMKERFQADQMPPPSVAEQIVAENKPQPMAMGLGAMAPQQMMPGAQGVSMPPSAPQIDPRQLAASGIAANPVNNVGTYAEGGIVGYGKGGEIDEDFIKYIESKRKLEAEKLKNTSILQKAKEGIKSLTNKIGNSKVAKKTASAYTRFKNIPYVGKTVTNPVVASALGLYGLSALFDDDLKVPPKLSAVPPGEMYNIAYEDVPTLQQGINAFNQQLPPSATREALDTRVLEMQERIDKERADAGNMSTILTGLAIAGGKSPNAISNIAAGATAGVQDYTKRVKDADKSELTTLQLRQGLEQADRREKLAALQFGNMSREAVLARNAKKEIAELLYFSQEKKLENAYRIEIIKNDQGYSDLESQLKTLLAAEKITTKYYTEQLKNYVDAAVAEKTKTVGSSGPVQVTSKEDIEALEPGTTYITPNGTVNIR